MDALPNRPDVLRPLTEKQVKEWLDYEGEPLLKRRDDEVLPALDRTLQVYPYIADGHEEAAGLLADNIRIGKALLVASEKQRTEQKAPYLNGGRAVDGWFKLFAEPIARALVPLERILLDYSSRKVEEEAVQLAAEPSRAEAADASRVRGDYGAVASVRTVWTWEIVDQDKIPRAYMTVDGVKVKATAQKKRDPKTGKPLINIPGIRWVMQRSLGVR
jgi:hypothetical protein